eukprot:1460259-Rhodomonas_salina.1
MVNNQATVLSGLQSTPAFAGVTEIIITVTFLQVNPPVNPPVTTPVNPPVTTPVNPPAPTPVPTP